MRLKIAAAAVLGVFLSSCSLNPYHSNFKCPMPYNGKCVSMQEAYTESIHNTDGKPKKKPYKPRISFPENSKQSLYKEELYGEIAKLIKNPETPFVVPPKVMRVYIMPYTNANGDLEMGRYVYFFAGKPKWILGGVK